MAFWKPGAERPDVPVDRDLRDAGVSIVINPLASCSIDVQRRSLPIFAHRKEILYALEMFGAVVIVGETGSGKSTQILQYLHEAGWTSGGRAVCCTQPRRVAVSTLAARVADEMGVPLGSTVGYAIRFQDITSDDTVIKYVTDGILLRELLADPLLTKYSVIMLDEAHERGLNTDLLAGLLKKVRRRRPDLRIIVSSATLDASKFRDFFDMHLDDTLTALPPVALQAIPDVKPAQSFIPTYTGPQHPAASQIKSSSSPAIDAAGASQHNEAVADELVLAGIDSDAEEALESLVSKYGLKPKTDVGGGGEAVDKAIADAAPDRTGARRSRSRSNSTRHKHRSRRDRSRSRHKHHKHSKHGHRRSHKHKHSKHSRHRSRTRSQSTEHRHKRIRVRSPSSSSSSRSSSPAPKGIQTVGVDTAPPSGQPSSMAEIAKPAPPIHRPVVIRSIPAPASAAAPIIDNKPVSIGTQDLFACIVLEIEGRTHAVEQNYVEHPVRDVVIAAAETVLYLHTTCPAGDVLVFLPGQEEIEDCCDLINERLPSAFGHEHLGQLHDEQKLIVAPLYANLPWERQAAALEPAPILKTAKPLRKVVVATNIAETSVTIPDVVYVVDSGLCKLAVFDPIGGIDVLLTLPVSQASAMQRAGRAGRVRPGKCFRLYTEEEFYALPIRTTPEILRCDPSSMLLQMLALGVSKVALFDFLDPPLPAAMIKSLGLLHALGAVDSLGNLVQPKGAAMADLPVDPRCAAMLVAALENGCAELIITVAAVSQVQDIFLGWRSSQTKQAMETADEVMKEFAVTEGDFVTMINVYRAFENSGRSSAWSREHLMNHKALLRVGEIRHLLRRALTALVAREVARDPTCPWSIDTAYTVQDEPDAQTLRKCITAGYFSNVAQYEPSKDCYRILRGGAEALLHPQSVYHRLGRKPEWIVYTDAVRTTSLYLRDVTPIHPRWLLELAPHYYSFYGVEHGTEQKFELNAPQPSRLQPEEGSSAATSGRIVYKPKSARVNAMSAANATTKVAVAAGATTTSDAPPKPKATRGLASLIDSLFDD